MSKHINYSNQKNHYYYQIIKLIVNFCSNKGENKYNSSPQLTRLHNSLLMIIFDNPEKYLSNVEKKSDMKKVCKSSIKSSSTLFSCSINEKYNIVDHVQKKRLVLNS